MAQLALAAKELPPLRAAMGDLQRSISAFYAETGRSASLDTLGTHARSFLVNTQVINEFLSRTITDKATYNALFAQKAPGTTFIQAAKYARNISQHVLHVVKPADNFHIIGGVMGMRIYVVWDDVPAAVHDALHTRTQKLRPNYDAEFNGQGVVGTMLAVARFFAEVAPEIVHRDHRGEWTGFPLMSQPGVGAPLHPEEPEEQEAAHRWLNQRRPGGDIRVIAAQITADGTTYLLGHTFAGRVSFAPFVETVTQVQDDMDAGFPYVTGKTFAHVTDCSADFPEARQGVVFRSTDDIATWTTPYTHDECTEDWCEGYTLEQWQRMRRVEQLEEMFSASSYGVRRARRLNAFIPPGR